MFLLFSIFVLIFIIFILYKIYINKKFKVKELEKREDFYTENEYLKKFIPIFKESKSNFYFFSGAAGTGKSFFINEFSDYLKFNNLKFRITSTTGVSAIDFKDGITIHAFAGLQKEQNLNQIIKNLKYKKDLQKIDVLIIDEISMLSNELFDLLNQVLQKIRENKEYFGGIKLLLFGDFFQLPPISKNKNSSIPWVFKSKTWKKLNFVYLNLNKNYRQKDREFIKHLNRLRLGLLNDEDSKYFEKLKIKSDKKFINLRSKKEEVHEINNKHLKDNKNELYIFNSFSNNKYISEIKNYKAKFEESLSIKVGIRVMHLINDFENNLINGSTGTVSKITNNKIFINWDKVGEKELKKHFIFKYDSFYRQEEILFSQYPIKISHALTIHKSQGMSLEYVDIDCEKMFADGHAYVALSRAKDPFKINLKNWNEKIVHSNLEVLDFYKKNNKNFIKLSQTDFNQFIKIEEIKFIYEKNYWKKINNLWKEEDWIKENLIKNELINEYEYEYYSNQAGVYRITILDKENNKEFFYIGESNNLIQRLTWHISNAFDSDLKLSKKQSVTKTIQRCGIENIKFEILTDKEWFIGKYITLEDWENLDKKNKYIIKRKFLKHEETIEIEKLKSQVDNKLIQNRTHGL